MKLGLKILLALTISLTGLWLHAQPLEATLPTGASVAENNEARFKIQYEQTREVLPKLHLDKTLDLTLPVSPFPHTAFVQSRADFYKKYLLVIRWLSGKSSGELACAASAVPPQSKNESPEQIALRESRSLQIGQDGLRNFDVAEYVAKVPGFQDCGLKPAEVAAVYDYTNSFYQRLNPALRQRDSNEARDPEMEKKIDAFTTTLDLALNKLAPYRGWVKRGTNFSTATKAKYIKGAIVSDLAYTSASRNQQFNGDDQLMIFSKTGRYIAPLSANHAEEEVLFQRGARFLVIDVYQDAKDPYVQHYTLIEQ